MYYQCNILIDIQSIHLNYVRETENKLDFHFEINWFYQLCYYIDLSCAHSKRMHL